MAVGFQLGGSSFKSGGYDANGKELFSNNNSSQFIMETYVRNTFNLYKGLNLYIGAALGQNMVFDDATLIKRGINKNFDSISKRSSQIYFKFQYGLAIMF